MNRKRMCELIIVLFLLAALPGMTAVVAQGQEPARKAPLPTVIERGESNVSIPWQDNESEPNNTFATADLITDWARTQNIAGGRIGYGGDVDFWALDIPEVEGSSNWGALIDIDARSFGSPLDPVICLYSDNFIQLACNDDTDTLDSMLYYNFEAGRRYYLRVTDYYGERGGDDFKYILIWSFPLLVSAAANNLGTGYVDGIPFQAGDILALSALRGPGYSNYAILKWVMLFDLSDLGVRGNVTNLAAGWRNSDYLLLGFAANVSLPGVSQTVTPWDVVVFDPSQLGPATEGAFQRWWVGREHGLTTASEKIDAIDWPNWEGTTRLYVSTVGRATVTGDSGQLIRLEDEDIGLWMGNSNRWEMNYDGSDFPGLATEDVMGLTVTPCYEGDRHWYDAYSIVIQGAGILSRDDLRFAVTQKDIAFLQPGWAPWWGIYRWGWTYKIDAIEDSILGLMCDD